MFGVIADDVTGATDVAVALRRNGLRTFLWFGVPQGAPVVADAEATVIALKTRMIEPDAAVSRSLAAWEWLRQRGATRCYFKYCSTFDSTARGNIGPVLDALVDATGAATVVTTPSSPEHGRTQYGGHLFVGDVLLSESHMRDHPVTPMRDSNLPRLLRAQSRETVGLLGYRDVLDGETAIARRLASARADGVRYLLADAVTDADLRRLGRAVVDEPLMAGAAGLAGGLAAALAERRPGGVANGTVTGLVERRARDAVPADGTATGLVERRARDAGRADGVVEAASARQPAEATGAARAAEGNEAEPPPNGRAVVLSGSCSARTLEQVEYLRQRDRPAFFLDVAATPDAEALAEAALAWYDTLPANTAPLIYSSVEPERLHHIQQRIGVERAAAILEDATGRIAHGLAARGVRRFIAAGGETSGAVVAALRVEGGLIGTEAARGVPWIHAGDVSLLLKSGNFGEPDLLARASAPGGDE